MYFDKERWNKYGTISLIDTDGNGKRFRIPKDKIPSFIYSPEDAINYCKSMAAQREAAHIKSARRREWESRRFDFKFLLEKFEKARKREAPNSWESDVSYARTYVIPFFLNEAKSNSVLLWSDHYDEFRDWLAKVQPIKRGSKKTLAVSTQNLCMKVLNNFLNFMMRKEGMEAVPLCKTYPRRLLRRKGVEDVMSLEVQKKIHDALTDTDLECAEFFQLLIQTGLRSGEALGLSMKDTLDTQPGGALLKMLEQYSLSCYGYILLDSQVFNPLKIRLPDGTVPRRPLKHRSKIDPMEGRTIPIFSMELFNLIRRRWLLQKEKFDQQIYGPNSRDYLLFDKLGKIQYATALRKACRKAKVKEHVPHDSRHTYSTELVGKTNGHYLLAQTILGHSSLATTSIYSHVTKDDLGDLEIY